MKEAIKKLRFKGENIVVINAPEKIKNELKEIGFYNSLDNNQKSENTLAFINNKKEFLHFLDSQMKDIAYDGLLWFAYPKMTSKIKTDINRDILWKTAEPFGIRPVNLVALDDTWSALRFRPIEKVTPSPSKKEI